MIKVIIDGKELEFKGDELTSPESEVILFLQQRIKDKAEF